MAARFLRPGGGPCLVVEAAPYLCYLGDQTVNCAFVRYFFPLQTRHQKGNEILHQRKAHRELVHDGTILHPRAERDSHLAPAGASDAGAALPPARLGAIAATAAGCAGRQLEAPRSHRVQA